MLAIGPRFRRLADMPAPDLSPRMSVATTLGAEPRPNGSPARIDDLVDNPAPADVLFLGLYRPDEVIAALSKRWRLVPIAEGRAMAAPATPHVNLGCAVLDPGRVDPSLAECEVTMGWYQLVSR